METLIRGHIELVLKSMGVTVLPEVNLDHLARRVASSIWMGPQGPNADEFALIKALIWLRNYEESH